MFLARRVSLGITIALFSVGALAADLPRINPESVGLSFSRLERIGEVFRGKVAISRNLATAPQSRF